jgi:hypothetical protein
MRVESGADFFAHASDNVINGHFSSGKIHDRLVHNIREAHIFK